MATVGASDEVVDASKSASLDGDDQKGSFSHSNDTDDDIRKRKGKNRLKTENDEKLFEFSQVDVEEGANSSEKDNLSISASVSDDVRKVPGYLFCLRRKRKLKKNWWKKCRK